MHIKQNLFSKISSVLFIIIMAGVFYMSVYRLFYKQADGGFVLALYAGGLLLLLFIIFIVTKLTALKPTEKHSVFLAFEIMSVCFLMIHGMILRTMPQIVFNSQNTAYFDVSVSLQKGMMMPNMEVIIEKIMDMPSLFGYGKLISFGFAIFGTKPEVLFYSNLIFQMLGIFFIYRITRRLAGVLYSVLTLAFCVYMPSLIFAVYSFHNAAMFSCFLFGTILLALYLSDFKQEETIGVKEVLLQVALGLLLGLMVFIEPISIILVVIILITQFQYRKKHVIRGFISLVTLLGGLTILMIWMSSSLKIGNERCIQSYLEELIPDFMTGEHADSPFSLKEVTEQYSLLISESGNDISTNYESLLYHEGTRLSYTFVGLLQVINQFLYLLIVIMSLLSALYILIGRNIYKKERRTVFLIWLCIGVMLMMFLHVDRLYHTIYYIGLLLILAGTALRLMYLSFLPLNSEDENEQDTVPLYLTYLRKPKDAIAEVSETVEKDNQELLQETKQVDHDEAPSKDQDVPELIDVSEELEETKETPKTMEVVNSEIIQPEEKPIQYIENPLPLPKKHVNRNRIDYALEVSEDQMKYDIEVSEEDDWDH